jgi:hypothetical protein
MKSTPYNVQGANVLQTKPDKTSSFLGASTFLSSLFSTFYVPQFHIENRKNYLIIYFNL